MNQTPGGAGGTTGATTQPGSGRRPRDPRLDFFRGLAMFIILFAHTRENAWTLWIPARFGYSDATEIFVFCSGFASALAFGAVFLKRSWTLGAARIAFRVWQVYWAHIGILLVSALILFTIDRYDLGLEDHRYIAEPYLVPLFRQTGDALFGLFTLTYVPGLFDILPMYLVILAMIPVVMALYRVGGRAAVAVFVIGVWGAATLAGTARMVDGLDDPTALAAALASVGRAFEWMNLPGNPFDKGTWFFNPFAWQLVFFTGFAFGMGWLPAPPVDRRLVALAAAFLLLSLPFAWHKIHGAGGYIPADWAISVWITETRGFLEPLWWKTWQGIFRFAHFLSLAYLAWVAVGEGGRRLREGFPAPRAPSGGWLWATGAVALVTVPYAYVEEIKALAPALDAWLLTVVPVAGDRIGLLQIAHLVALVLLGWAALGPVGRRLATRRWLPAAVPVIRKVGTQSLAVFMTSIPLAVTLAWLLDLTGRNMWTVGAINLFGCGVLIATAYLVSWFKSQPWRAAPAAARDSAEGRAQPPGRTERSAERSVAARA